MKTRSYKDLIVWQKAIELVLAIYELTRKFPKNEEYGLVSQLCRAAVSIPSNIAEGYARQHLSEYVQFLSTASGSCAELGTQLIISRRLHYGTEYGYLRVFLLLDEVSKILHVMKMKLKGYPKH